MYGPVAALVLLAAAYSLYWQVSADTFAAELDKANGSEVMPGIVFAFAEKEIGGFPFRLDATLSGVTFAHRGTAGETAWRAEKLALHMLSYGSAHYVFEAAGLQSIAWPGEDATPQVLFVTPGTARASARVEEGKLARLDLDVIGAGAQDAAPSAPNGRNVSSRRVQLHLRSNGDRTIDVAIKIEGTRIGPGYAPALGRNVPLFSLQGKLSHGETLDDLRAAEDSFMGAIEKWRRAGGTLRADVLSVEWSGAMADAKCSLFLDDKRRPAGSLQGFVSGAKALVVAAARLRQGKPEEMEPAAKAITLLANMTTDAQGRLPASLALQNGEIRLGSARIGTMSPLY